MYERDVYKPNLAVLSQPKLQHPGDKSSVLSIEMLKGAYMLAAIKFRRVRDKQPIKKTKDHQNSKSKILYF